jgi:hypothetical protein
MNQSINQSIALPFLAISALPQQPLAKKEKKKKKEPAF